MKNKPLIKVLQFKLHAISKDCIIQTINLKQPIYIINLLYYYTHLTNDHNFLIIYLLHVILMCNNICANALLGTLSAHIKCFSVCDFRRDFHAIAKRGTPYFADFLGIGDILSFLVGAVVE